jgi:hypothetical protein
VRDATYAKFEQDLLLADGGREHHDGGQKRQGWRTPVRSSRKRQSAPPKSTRYMSPVLLYYLPARMQNFPYTQTSLLGGTTEVVTSNATSLLGLSEAFLVCQNVTVCNDICQKSASFLRVRILNILVAFNYCKQTDVSLSVSAIVKVFVAVG